MAFIDSIDHTGNCTFNSNHCQNNIDEHIRQNRNENISDIKSGISCLRAYLNTLKLHEIKELSENSMKYIVGFKFTENLEYTHFRIYIGICVWM